MAWFNEGAPRRRLWGHALWSLSWLMVTLFGVVLRPDGRGHGTHQQLGLPPCPSVLLFHRPCPGCGLTTSISAVLHGDVALSWSAHPFGIPLYSLWTLTAFACGFGWWTGKRFNTEGKAFSIALGTFFGLFFLFGVLRSVMTPSYGLY